MPTGDQTAMPADDQAAMPADDQTAMPADDQAAMPGDSMTDSETESGLEDDSTAKYWSELSDEDKEAARHYIQKLANKGGEQQQQEGGQAPVQESFIFTKKQIAETLRNLHNDDREKTPSEPEAKSGPFSPKKFNRK